MYRKKNSVEKAKDLEACAAALEAEHKAIGQFFTAAEDYGAGGHVRCSWMLVMVEDAHGPARMAHDRTKETHVGDGKDIEGKWAHTTHSHVYEND